MVKSIYMSGEKIRGLRKKINVNKFHTAGSLRNSYFNNFLKEENFNTVYDICFVSKNIWGMNDYTEPAKIILGYFIMKLN